MSIRNEIEKKLRNGYTKCTGSDMIIMHKNSKDKKLGRKDLGA